MATPDQEDALTELDRKSGEQIKCYRILLGLPKCSELMEKRQREYSKMGSHPDRSHVCSRIFLIQSIESSCNDDRPDYTWNAECPPVQ